ncbi:MULTISPECIES: hypothetical protein [unclassified Corallococcus]|uniref:hypothetical protein n=1 Tax=unclassified Corallococcus TaxID=2685029 RepID=UPI001F5D683B|nr:MULTISPECIES: hypothetical protein [unclassified Corallococcus]WAS88751.1 hypothetical protein O0N60_17595 [Corallococcus sp. NCRR]
MLVSRWGVLSQDAWNSREAAGQFLGVRVVLGLAHRPAEDVLVAPCLGNEVLAASEYRHDGSAQALGEVDPEGVDLGREPGG